MIDTKEHKERLILVAVNCDNNYDVNDSLDELEELVKTAGALAVERVIQNREKEHSTTYIGKGKIEDIKEIAYQIDATGIVCDDELSPVQFKNLEDALQLKVMDRTVLILDIFASRASTKEGKIQVELAQLKYRSTRLAGSGSALSRLGGGIGTRGPGEKKLEVDRRLIKDRISILNRELSEVRKNREIQRTQRNKTFMPIISIVGYTNAGKSTLLNKLTDAKVLEEDKLFATLDPTTRNYIFESGQQVLFTDTVGFIRKLPHHLIEAFKSTLEEANYSDIILHVVDASNKSMDTHMQVVYETLNNLGVEDKPIITVFNKIDKAEDNIVAKDLKAKKVVKISAKYGYGIENLQNILEEVLREQKVLIEKVFLYNEAGKIQLIRKYGQILEENYKEDGIYLKAYISKEKYFQL